MEDKTLEKLWELLSNYRCINGYPQGLKKVNFNLPPEEFKTKHSEGIKKLMRPTIQKIVESPQEMLDILSGEDVRKIKVHHLSCAGDVGGDENNALCVHYIDGENRYALVVPGIGYIKEL